VLHQSSQLRLPDCTEAFPGCGLPGGDEGLLGLLGQLPQLAHLDLSGDPRDWRQPDLNRSAEPAAAWRIWDITGCGIKQVGSRPCGINLSRLRL